MSVRPVFSRVSARRSQVEVLFVFQGLARRTITDAVLEILVELKQCLQHRNQNPQAAGQRSRKVKARGQRHNASRDDFNALQPFVHPAIVAALAIVPADLVFQPFQGWVGLAHLRSSYLASYPPP